MQNNYNLTAITFKIELLPFVGGGINYILWQSRYYPVHKPDILTLPGIGVYSFFIVDFVRGHFDVEYFE